MVFCLLKIITNQCEFAYFCSMKKIIIQDESMTGKLLNELLLQIDAETITVADLIKARVHAEVEQFNQNTHPHYYGLVQPAAAELVLNGYKMKKDAVIDAEKQTYVALDAFQKNGFFVLVDNYQVGDLHEEILIDEDTKVSFVRLTPLVGG